MIRKLRYFALFSYTLILCQTAFTEGSQTPATPFDAGKRLDSILITDVSNLWNTTMSFSRSLIETKNRHMILLAVTSIAVALSIPLLDQKLRDVLQTSKNEKTSHLIQPWESYGNGLYIALITTGMYCSGLTLHNDRMRIAARDAINSLLITSVVNSSLKVIIGRSRPHTGKGPWNFGFLRTHPSYWSLPSGHTAAAFSLSSALAAHTDNTYFRIMLYGMATLVALQRIYDDRHWFSDVFTGAVLGTGIGTCIATNCTRHQNNSHVSRVTFFARSTLISSSIGLCIRL